MIERQGVSRKQRTSTKQQRAEKSWLPQCMLGGPKMTEVMETRVLQTLVNFSPCGQRGLCLCWDRTSDLLYTYTYLHYFNVVTNYRQPNGEKGTESLHFLLNQTLDLMAKTCASARGYLLHLSTSQVLPPRNHFRAVQRQTWPQHPDHIPQWQPGRQPSPVFELFCLPVTTQPQKTE